MMEKIYKYILISLVAFSCGSEDAAVPGGVDVTGTGGSLARFTISHGHLYAVDEQKLLTFSLADEMAPAKVDEFDLEWGVETIFAMDTIVFVGTQTGMHMFDITNSSRPGYLSSYEHIQSCDPVVAQDTLAFVTLRSGNLCRTGADQLEVIDIRNLKSPKLIKAYDMQNPHGLAVSGNYLFVCEGQYGLKVFEIKPGAELEMIKHYTSIRSKDVIIRGNILIVVADDGLFQYDYSDVRNIQELSQIKITY